MNDSAAEARAEVARLVEEARGHFAARRVRKTVDTLHAAQVLATGKGLHREAVEVKRALAITANGGRPRLLARGR